MKLFSHFPAVGISNTYIVSHDGEALLIDPGIFDTTLLDLIEDNHLNLTSVLITKDSHGQGLSTLTRIYSVKVIAGQDQVSGVRAHTATDGEIIRLSGLEVRVMAFPEYHEDSRVYHLNHCLFTGDVLSAGRTGNSYADHSEHSQLKDSIRKRILTLRDDLIIFPGHGPPTTVEAEQRWNSDLGNRPGSQRE